MLQNRDLWRNWMFRLLRRNKNWRKWEFEEGRSYLGIGDLQSARSDGLGEDLALWRHHCHRLVQGSAYEIKTSMKTPPKFLSTHRPRLPPQGSLPGTAGEPLPVLMAKLPGGSAAAGTTMPGGGLEAGGRAAGELCSISWAKKEAEKGNFIIFPPLIDLPLFFFLPAKWHRKGSFGLLRS